MNIAVPIIILLIAIPNFYLIRYLLKRRIKDEKKRNATSVIITIILAPILYVGIITAFFSYLFHEPQFDFEKERWFANERKRFEMRDDLVKSNILIGKTKNEIIQLIGRSESADSTDFWTYNLGMSSSGLGWQFNSLQLIFENGIVIDVEKQEQMD